VYIATFKYPVASHTTVRALVIARLNLPLSGSSLPLLQP